MDGMDRMDGMHRMIDGMGRMSRMEGAIAAGVGQWEIVCIVCMCALYT
jgi:hypothetical protein